MNVQESIESLKRERHLLVDAVDLLDRAITTLESLTRRSEHRRGRKGMNAEERQEVSERMKKYWAGKKRGKSA